MTKTTQLHEKMLAMNEALMLGSLRQHELAEAKELLNVQLQKEITERKQVEVALRESEQRYRTLFDLGPVAIYSCNASGVIQNFNRIAAELWGREPALGETGERFCGAFKLFHPDGRFMPHEQCPMAEVLSGKIPEARDAEVLIERPDGSRITVVVNIRPLKNQRGEITGAINCAYDITERKRAIAHERLLLNELAHRSQNLLSVVQSIASRTLSGALSLTEARDAFIERLAALSHTQSALITDGFKGATVAELIRLEVKAFSDRITTEGPSVRLKPKIAQTFSLLLHELSTNAMKHGALSRSAGRVDIHWWIQNSGEEHRFKLRWRESGGPPVAPPTRQGFGRILLEKAAATEFGAKTKMQFQPDGLSYEIDVPLSDVCAEAVPALEPSPEVLQDYKRH